MKQKSDIQYWDENFLNEVEEKRIDHGILIWAFGGAAFAIRTPQAMLYLDPYFGGDPVEGVPHTYRTAAIPIDPTKIRLADAVLITHEHYDHCHEDTLLAMSAGIDVSFYGPGSVTKEMVSYNLPHERIYKVKPGDKIEIKDTVVSVWPGYDKDELLAVTYEIESGGVKVFFGGDSAVGPAFDEIGDKENLDIAMLSFGRTWYMNEAQILDAAERLHPRLLLPYHWEIWRGYTGDVLKLGRLIEQRQPRFDVQILLLGDYLHYLMDGRFSKGR